MRLSRKLRWRLAMLASALGCLIVLIALLSAPSPASYADHKFGAATAGAGETGPSGSEQSGAGETPSSHSHQHAHGSDVPDTHMADDSDPGFGGGYTFAENNPWGTNSGSSGQGGRQYPGNSGINFGDGRGFGGGGSFGGGFGGFGGYVPQGSGSGKQDGSDGSEDSGDSPGTTASLFQPEPGTDQPNNDESVPGEGPGDYTPPTLTFDDPSIDKITDAPSGPEGGDKPNGQAPVQVPEPSSWSMIVLALVGMAFWRMRAARQACFH